MLIFYLLVHYPDVPTQLRLGQDHQEAGLKVKLEFKSRHTNMR